MVEPAPGADLLGRIPLDLHATDRELATGATRKHLAKDAAAVLIGNLQRRRGPTGFWQPTLDGGKHEDHDEMAKGDRDGQDRKSGSAGHADRWQSARRSPPSSGPDDILANKNEAAADEADAGHDLRRDTRRIEHHPARFEDVGEAVFGDQHHERGREADERVGAQAGALLADLALEFDRRDRE